MPATYVTTRDVPLDELTPFPGNAKRGDVEGIRASLRRNGQYRGLVVREMDAGALIVLAGNHTMQALKLEGWETARCEIVRCDDAEARRINLADNKLAENGHYDDEALAALLEDLNGDLDGTGFTQAELDKLLDDGTSDALEGDADTDENDLGLWGVIVTCRSESEQTKLLDELTQQGHEVRALIN